MKATQLAAILIIAALTIVILVVGRGLLIPFVFALLIWLIVRSAKKALNKIGFIRSYFPGWLTSLILSAIIFTLFTLMAELLTSNIRTLIASYPTYEANILKVTTDINHLFKIDILKSATEYAGSFSIASALGSLFASLQGILGNVLMILLYVIFIFLEESTFPLKIKAIFTKDPQHARVLTTLMHVESSIANYIALKTFVNFVSAFLGFIIIWLVGVDSPVFWGFVLFIFNFIPAIGTLVGTSFAAAFALIQFGYFSPFLIIFFGVGTLQFIVGNMVEPRVMGNSLNISPLVTILALSFWGAIWGVTGMFLSVPITVSMILVFSEFPNTRAIAILLSEKGEV